MNPSIEALQAELDALWERYNCARRSGFLADAIEIMQKYRAVLLALDTAKGSR